ncbi:hypothetical protein AURDEDRAFT_165903 [Auricularia subglabra TFB-10046 SS5]|nr:hypothetical protein AURDEDRAFT_165903 [Auricularia subglabra TFB-10046 SS5]
MVGQLLPSRSMSYSYSSISWTPEEPDPLEWMVSTRELCLRCLHALLRQPRSALDDASKQDIILLLLENAALVRCCTIWERRLSPAPERFAVNLLTAIARYLVYLWSSPDTFDTGIYLFCLFSSSEAPDKDGTPVAWDLGVYLRENAATLTEHDPYMRVRWRRMLSAIRALRPFCMSRDDLHATWGQIGLVEDPDHRDPFWDADDFVLSEVDNEPVPGAVLVVFSP